MPKIRGDTTHAHPILVLLASIFGVIVAVPTLAVLKVLFDSFPVRLETDA